MRLFEAEHSRTIRPERDMAAKRTRITVERDTIMLVRHARAERAWCPICRDEVDVMALGSEALAELLAANEVQGWIAAGRLHVSREPNAPVRICLPSLLRCFEP